MTQHPKCFKVETSGDLVSSQIEKSVPLNSLLLCWLASLHSFSSDWSCLGKLTKHVLSSSPDFHTRDQMEQVIFLDQLCIPVIDQMG